MSDDIERKARNAKWAASELYDLLGLLQRHENHMSRVWERFKNEPEFIDHLTSLGLLTEIKKRVGAP